ncbi:autotransporter outer membrane beta-barrel domain-containing protein [Caproiciproducens faecalis]|uniref:Carbohydrate-binding domain-containing protein n=1 Tax=Caproiciproducens faecalis TaxID=2820301 RepID=A0ABS7DLG8_9FIRM|nr:hypothetical protein [Caproiciproducens faecalis]MBW7571396.1 hypothetical protein [Caproiciproducens faecalis]
MKKIISVFLSLAVIVLSVPVAVQAATDAEIIDKHGAKTYQGTASAWSTAWNEDSFTEVTGSNVTANNSLTIKAGEVKDVTVSGSSSKVTISGGTVSDVVCDGSAEVSGGTVNSLQSNGDITLRGGTIKHDVESYQKVTISGKIAIGGSVLGNDVDISSGSSGSSLSGSIQAGGVISLAGNGMKIKEISGEDTATLSLKNYSGKLPVLTDLGTISVDASSTVTANGNVEAGNLTIAAKGEFVTASLLDLDTLTGPGTLSFNTGKLTVHNNISEKPLLNFNNSARNGQTAFKADRGMVGEDEVLLYDFELERETSDDGDMDEFVLSSTLKEGVTLSKSAVALDGKNSVTVQASVKPSFSQFAEGTKLVWEMHGETSGFTISSNGLSCQVSAKGTSSDSYKATLVAYLVDKRGDRLADYKSDSCTLSYGTPSNSTGSDLTLDTYAVTIGAGGTYWVLAITDSKTAPVAMSYNSSVATVGAAAAYNKNGKVGWLFPVTGVAKGGVTIDIAGQKMITTIAAGSVVVDTASYTMGPGGKYFIGVKISGIDRKNVNVHSQNACTMVQYAGKNKSGLDLYAVTAGQTGVGAVIFEIVGGQSVQTQITVANGAKPHGVSGRLIAAA